MFPNSKYHLKWDMLMEWQLIKKHGGILDLIIS